MNFHKWPHKKSLLPIGSKRKNITSKNRSKNAIVVKESREENANFVKRMREKKRISSKDHGKKCEFHGRIAIKKNTNYAKNRFETREFSEIIDVKNTNFAKGFM